jgi:hypoxanthine phosphoribosyltransferase
MPTTSRDGVAFPKSMNPDEIDEVLFTQEVIARRVRELGAEISDFYDNDYDDDERRRQRTPLVVVCTLKGAALFFADLVRSLTVEAEWEFAAFSSYGDGTASAGSVVTILDVRTDVSGRDLLIVEDILDSGHTLRHAIDLLSARGPRSVRTAVLLHKEERTVGGLGLKPEFVGFNIPNKFVVGYGLDYAQRYRCLPWIGVLAPWVYDKDNDDAGDEDDVVE